MEAPKLEWSGAHVRDGILTVEIAGDRPKGWKSTFEQTVRLLGGGDWGEVKLKAGKIRVSEVREGSEESLRHFLEGVVQEANAVRVDTDDGDGDDHEDDQDTSGDDDDGADDVDARMTGRFRGNDAG
jgi:hypothetical protein